jgi:hypothetical protein
MFGKVGDECENGLSGAINEAEVLGLQLHLSVGVEPPSVIDRGALLFLWCPGRGAFHNELRFLPFWIAALQLVK